MEKTFLRRDRNHHSPISQKNRLTKLKIPIPEGQSLPLERRNSEIGALKKSEQSARYIGARSRCGFSDHAHGSPSLHVARGHSPPEHLAKTALHLHCSPLIVRRIPSCWDKAGRSCHRPWIPGSIGQIG